MFGGVVCGGGFVYGVLFCGGQGKGWCTFFTVGERFDGHGGCERYAGGTYGKVGGGDGDDNRKGAF